MKAQEIVLLIFSIIIFFIPFILKKGMIDKVFYSISAVFSLILLVLIHQNIISELYFMLGLLFFFLMEGIAKKIKEKQHTN
ncbi:hypothetical protein H7904_11310 [Staphylococcus capitis]|jgi:predicted branched-subunit amino acid permease|uniref:hypothetical protein n=1 Tax=Staphylococcus TaxID=1279 RepID=UPI00066ABEBB|nr:hypothetical protein [Staphylococcus capitis]HBH2233861.1 hypothetical protein [Clostridioides difficile]MBC3081240.1 hypothetical protein [Staphylococcus capitis]MDS3986488.1 hypothetical protein [Staphylococcus capitis]MDS3990959.1 hypothetical protein [Staphylococcus capitis]MDS4018855.1 hypothetical protein [Staphylococcus capitis]